jgi:hypothetical protein
MTKGYIQLITKSVDLNSTQNSPSATFTLQTDNYLKHYKGKIMINCRFIIENNINFNETKTRVKVTSNGDFSFPIPQNVIGMELSVKVKSKDKSVNKLLSYYPDNCKPDFTSNYLPLRKMIKMCANMILNASGLSQTQPSANDQYKYGEQVGPTRAGRAMAISWIAMFEAVNSIIGGYQSYMDLTRAHKDACLEAAVLQATKDTLLWLYPSQAYLINPLYQTYVNQINDGSSKIKGIEAGTLSAQKIIQLRTNDGSQTPEPVVGVDYFPSDQPGQWRPDPLNPSNNKAFGAFWNQVKPFVIQSADQFRPSAPPNLTSSEYAMCFDQVKAVGGDGVMTPTVRDQYEFETGLYWAYDGTPILCAPPKLFNEMSLKIAFDQGISTLSLLRLMAIINVALADTGIACWEAKYHYKYWRPVCGIREADVGTGQSGLGDGNPETVGDPNWTPYGAPQTNIITGAHVTPSFPAYPSGHATFGGTLFQLLRNFYQTDNLKFTFVSDELDGKTKDSNGQTRPYLPRTFDTFSQAEQQCGQGRMSLGLHWQCDKTSGILMGNQIGNYIYSRLFQPI